MKPRTKRLPCLIIFFLIVGLIVASAPVQASEPLVIGIPHSETYTYANMMKNSFEMALETINKQGGIKGRTLKFA